MHKNSLFEISLCAAVIVVAVGFLVFMRLQTGTGSLSSYALVAQMKQVDSLAGGADVRIGGVKIGSITDLTIEPKSFLADVHMDIRKDVGIPKDSAFDIGSAVMSSPYLSITPGKSNEMLAPGATFRPR